MFRRRWSVGGFRQTNGSRAWIWANSLPFIPKWTHEVAFLLRSWNTCHGSDLMNSDWTHNESLLMTLTIRQFLSCLWSVPTVSRLLENLGILSRYYSCFLLIYLTRLHDHTGRAKFARPPGFAVSKASTHSKFTRFFQKFKALQIDVTCLANHENLDS
jgi:hypothetical protein